MLLTMLLMLADPTGLTIERVEFATGAREKRVASAAGIESTLAKPIGDRLSLPSGKPYPAHRLSRFSTLYRARDLFDVARYPASAVAKLHRLDAAGKRTEHACTAQFVGARHLITAAHCIVDLSDRAPHAAFEIAIGYDNGQAATVAPVLRAWVDDQPGLAVDRTRALVTPERCSDFALIEIADPIGERTGWLGMATDADAQTPLYRFSYPHVPAYRGLERSMAKLPASQRVKVESTLARSRTHEPDFSPDNLYFEFGTADQVERRYLADSNGYIAPGRSGAALVGADGAIRAIMSRGYDGKLYSCRLTPQLIGAFAAIIADKGL